MERIRIDRRHPSLRARRRGLRPDPAASPLAQPLARRPAGRDDVDTDLLDRIDALLAAVPADPATPPAT